MSAERSNQGFYSQTIDHLDLLVTVMAVVNQIYSFYDNYCLD